MLMLTSMGFPQEGVAFILGVDRLLDMSRTVVNITSDAVGYGIVAAWEAPQQQRG